MLKNSILNDDKCNLNYYFDLFIMLHQKYYLTKTNN